MLTFQQCVLELGITMVAVEYSLVRNYWMFSHFSMLQPQTWIYFIGIVGYKPMELNWGHKVYSKEKKKFKLQKKKIWNRKIFWNWKRKCWKSLKFLWSQFSSAWTNIKWCSHVLEQLSQGPDLNTKQDWRRFQEPRWPLRPDVQTW